MGTDFSRVRLDPFLDYAGVELRQGMVLLDSDVNEGTDIVDRRLRALGSDLLGPVVVSATTPDAFEIKASGGTLTIGVGRLLLDGLLVECHGGDPAVAADRLFDSLMAEPKYKNPLPYAGQPYLHPLVPPVLPKTGRHLVYLRAWNREVTHLEQPDLVEIAVGVDTSSRIQTVWQVLVLDQAAGGDATCATPDAELPGWTDIIAPSTGTLTTGTYEVAPADNPCELPPTGGYRGLENQLYRVEIHDPTGAPGGPTFKWSRVNKSVGSRVASIVSSSAAGGTVLELETLGRDDVLSFQSNDWVEIVDNTREFASRPGEIRKIAVDAAQRRISFKPALPADLLPTPAAFPDSTFPATRDFVVRRWDQKALVKRTDPSGTPVTVQDLDSPPTGVIGIPSPATTLILENGVTVRFDPGPRGFRSGDYWVFAARTADASVEPLDHAPPRGIHYHYTRLAMWDAGAGTVADCRPKRTAGCCTFVVKPGENIQEAINALPPAGGCVCLKAGLHGITAPIRIVRDNVTLHGESLGAIVENPRGSSLLEIEGAEHSRVHTIVFRPTEAATASVIQVLRAEDLVIDDCRVEATDGADTIGLRAIGSADVTVSGCEFLGPSVGLWFDGGCRDITVSACEFVLARGGNIAASVAILARNMTGPITVEENDILGMGDGIIVNDDPNGRPVSRARGSRIWANRLRLLEGRLAAGQTDYGIDVAAPGSSVGDNRIEHDRGADFMAIRLGGSDAIASGNMITTGQTGGNGSIAIMVGDINSMGATGDFSPLRGVIVADNIVEGPQNGIVLAGAARSRVAGNLLGQGEASQASVGIALFSSPNCCVTENAIAGTLFGILAVLGERTSISGNRVDRGDNGILVGLDRAPTISGNRLTDLAQSGITIGGTTERCNVIENRVLRCGSAAGVAVAVNASNIFGELHVESNEIMDTGAGSTAKVAYGIFGENIWEARIESNLVTYSDPNSRDLANEDRALRLRGAFDLEISDNITIGFAVQIANNKFIGPGKSALVELWQLSITDNLFVRFERVLFHGNYCWHFARPAAGNPATGRLPLEATVSVVGRHCSVTGNHVKATANPYPSYNVHGMPGPFIGNVSHSGHSGRLGGAQMPNPESAFNTNA